MKFIIQGIILCALIFFFWIGSVLCIMLAGSGQTSSVIQALIMFVVLCLVTFFIGKATFSEKK